MSGGKDRRSIQEFEHRNPGFPHPGHLFQLTESFPGQSRHVIPPASSGSWSSESQPTELLILSLRESRKLISTTCTYGLIFSHYPELMTIGEGGPPCESPPYWSGGVCVCVRGNLSLAGSSKADWDKVLCLGEGTDKEQLISPNEITENMKLIKRIYWLDH